MRKGLLGALVVVVALTFALAVNAEKAKVTTKTKEGKEVTDVTTTPEGVNVIDVTKFKHGSLWKDKVVFKEYKQGDDFVYLLKENKTFRVKFREGAKDSLMKLKKGDPVKIVSTYPLTGPELQQYILLHDIEKAQ